MPAILPCLLSAAGGSIQCMHGGVFKGAASTGVTMNGDPVVISNQPFEVVTPCPGVPPSIPPCQLTAPALTMETRVTIDALSTKAVSQQTPQVSGSNGFPAFIAVTVSTTVKVI